MTGIFDWKFTRFISSVIKATLIVACSQLIAGMAFVISCSPAETNAGLVAHWTFDQDYSSEVNGSVFGVSARGTPSISTNAPALGSGCLYLNNSGSTISGLAASNANLLAISSNSWTVTFWMKRTGRAPSDTSDNYGTPLAAGWNMYIQDRGSPREIRTYCSSALVSSPARAVYSAPTNEWSFIAIVFDRGALTNRIYTYNTTYSNPMLELEEESALSAGYNVSFSEFTVGYVTASAPSQAFDGYLDDIRIYNHALSAAEIEPLIGRPGGFSDQPVRSNYQIYSPAISTSYIHKKQAEGVTQYNHEPFVAKLGSKWVALWQGNKVPKESELGQLMYMSTSTDGLNWTPEELAFATNSRSVNVIPNTTGVQWDGSLIIKPDETNKLYCFWSQTSFGSQGPYHGCYMSVLTNADGKWTNTLLHWDSSTLTSVTSGGGSNIVVCGEMFRIIPISPPLVVRGGTRVIVPCNLWPTNPALYRVRSSVLYSDDWITWHCSEGIRTIDDGEFNGQEVITEPTVWERPDGTLGMCVRFASITNLADAGKTIISAESCDGGATWTNLAHISIDVPVTQRHAMQGSFAGTQRDWYIMTMNDWPLFMPFDEFCSGRDRYALSFFFNRGGGVNFAPACMFVKGDDSANTARMALDTEHNALQAVYSEDSGIKAARISPLPHIATNYIFPRRLIWNDSPRPDTNTVDGSHRFYGEQYANCNNQVTPGTRFSAGTWVYDISAGPVADMWTDSGANSIMFSYYLSGTALTMPNGFWIYSDPPPAGVVSFCDAYNTNWPGRANWYYWGMSCDLSTTNGTVDFYIYGPDWNDGADGQYYWSQRKTFTHAYTSGIGPVNLRLGALRDGSTRSLPAIFSSGLFGRIGHFEMYTNALLTAQQHNTIYNKHAADFGFNASADTQTLPTDVAVYYNPIDQPSTPGFTLPADSDNGTCQTLTDNTLKLTGEASASLDMDYIDLLAGDSVDVSFAFKVLAGTTGTVFTCGEFAHPLRLVHRNGHVYAEGSAGTNDCGTVQSGDWTFVEMHIDACGADVRLNHFGKVTSLSNTPDNLWLFLGEGCRSRSGAVRRASSSILQYDVASVRTGVRQTAHKIGWWKFNGNGLDSSGYGHTAVLKNGAAYITNTFNTALNYKALSLDGVDDFAEITNVAPAAGSITVACWAKSDGSTWNANSCLVSRRPAFVLYPVKDTTTLKFGIWNASGVWREVSYDLSSISGFSLQGWHHYAGTYNQDTGELKLYVGGFLRNTVNIGKYGIANDTGRVCIGRDDDLTSGANFDGAIDDVRLFDTALDDDAIYRQAYGLNPSE